MEALDRVGHRPTPITEASDPQHNCGPIASLAVWSCLEPGMSHTARFNTPG